MGNCNCNTSHDELTEPVDHKTLYNASWAIIRQHNTPESCWIVIEQRVLDCTEFLQHHPNGQAGILAFAGKDATQAYRGHHHSAAADLKCHEYDIGALSEVHKLMKRHRGVVPAVKAPVIPAPPESAGICQQGAAIRSPLAAHIGWPGLLHFDHSGEHRCLQEYSTHELAHLDSPDDHGYTPLGRAASTMDGPQILELINAGASLQGEHMRGGPGILQLVATQGSVELLCTLLDRRAPVDFANGDGVTALSYAACYGNALCVQILLQAAANVNATSHSGATALHMAAGAGEVQCVVHLVQGAQEVDINAKDKRGQTALNWAKDPTAKMVLKVLGAAGGRSCALM